MVLLSSLFTLHLKFSVSRSCCLLIQNFPQLWFHHNHLSSNCFSSFLKYLLALEQHFGGFTTVSLNHHLNRLLLPHSTTISGSPLPILQGCKIHCRIPSYKWTYWLHGTYLQLKKRFPWNSNLTGCPAFSLANSSNPIISLTTNSLVSCPVNEPD